MSSIVLPEVILKGTPYEMGFQHGRAFSETIRKFVHDDAARVQVIRHAPLPADELVSLVRQHSEMINTHYPEAAEELRGLSEGAGITPEEAVLLQVRQELIRYGDPLADAMECSTLGTMRGGGDPLVGQTIDLPGNMASLGCIFHIIPEHSSAPEICMFGFCGLLGYLGMNSHGLSVNLNMVVSANWKPGVPPYLLVRKLLAAGSVQEGLDAIAAVPRSSSRSFMLADTHHLLTAELSATEIRTLHDEPAFHTNHFLHPDFINSDALHFLFVNSSRKRLRCLEQLTAAGFPQTQEEMFAVFADHTLFPAGICAHSEGNIRVQETVAAVVMEPARGKMYVRPGYACTGQTAEYGFNG